jgi:hypothetical protein
MQTMYAQTFEAHGFKRRRGGQSLVRVGISLKFHAARIAFRAAFLYNMVVTGKEALFL